MNTTAVTWLTFIGAFVVAILAIDVMLFWISQGILKLSNFFRKDK